MIAEEVTTSGSGSDPGDHWGTMGADPQEHAETGPLVPCKVKCHSLAGARIGTMKLFPMADFPF